MALNKNTLGQALYAVRTAYNNKTVDQLVQQYGTLENARMQNCIDEAQAIIDHITTSGELHVPGSGLSAPNGPVTGNSITGKMK